MYNRCGVIIWTNSNEYLIVIFRYRTHERQGVYWGHLVAELEEHCHMLILSKQSVSSSFWLFEVLYSRVSVKCNSSQSYDAYHRGQCTITNYCHSLSHPYSVWYVNEPAHGHEVPLYICSRVSVSCARRVNVSRSTLYLIHQHLVALMSTEFVATKCLVVLTCSFHRTVMREMCISDYEDWNNYFSEV